MFNVRPLLSFFFVLVITALIETDFLSPLFSTIEVRSSLP
jgi:hypothetical protein